MTEMDTYNALMLANEQAQNTGQILLTVLTGYLLIAFFMGKKLTTFQTCFVNIVFLLAYVSTWHTLIEYLETADYFREVLVSMESEVPVAMNSLAATSAYNMIMGGLLTVGALYFMWSVRHSEAE